MATCREIIATAYRKIRVRPRGSPMSSAEAEDGLTCLQSLYDEMVSNGTFGRILPAREGADATADENTRIFDTTDAQIAITLPEEYQDCEALTVDDNGYRPPKDQTVVAVSGGGSYIYSQILGTWGDLSDLALEDFAPLSERSKDGLACVLALRLADENGKQPGAVTVSAAQVFRSMLANKRGSERTVTSVEYF